MSILEDYDLLKRKSDLEKKIQGCKDSINLLSVLPQKLSHKANIPINSVCFFPGKVVKTNQIFVKCDDILIERSAYDAGHLLKKKLDGKHFFQPNIPKSE